MKNIGIMLVTLMMVVFEAQAGSGIGKDTTPVLVYNKTGHEIKVVFTAAGCSKLQHGHTEACDEKTILPDGFKHYSFKSATSNRAVHAYALNSNMYNGELGVDPGYHCKVTVVDNGLQITCDS